MIQVLLKHFIYEKCIDVILNQITLNFSDVKIDPIEKARLMRSQIVEHYLRNFPEIYKSTGHNRIWSHIGILI